MTLFIDVGTNGEIVLGNSEWLMTASCSAGPAFEGGGIRCGMRAEEGAIEHIDIEPSTLKPIYETNGGGAPRGICGSGMIDLLAAMLKAGVIDRRGRFRETGPSAYMRQGAEGHVYVLAKAEESALGEDIVFSQAESTRCCGRRHLRFRRCFHAPVSRASDRFDCRGFADILKYRRQSHGMLPDMDESKLSSTAPSKALRNTACHEAREECKRITQSRHT
jgi:hypothetical protein